MPLPGAVSVHQNGSNPPASDANRSVATSQSPCDSPAEQAKTGYRSAECRGTHRIDARSERSQWVEIPLASGFSAHLPADAYSSEHRSIQAGYPADRSPRSLSTDPESQSSLVARPLTLDVLYTNKVTPLKSPIPSGSTSSKRDSAIATSNHDHSDNVASHFAASVTFTSGRDFAPFEDHFGIWSDVGPTGELEPESHFADALGINARSYACLDLDLLTHDMTLGHADTKDHLASSFTYLANNNHESGNALEIARSRSRKRSIESGLFESDSEIDIPLTCPAPSKARHRQRARNIPNSALDSLDPHGPRQPDALCCSNRELLRRTMVPRIESFPSNEAAQITEFEGNFYPYEIYGFAQEPCVRAIVNKCIESWVPGQTINVSLSVHSFHCALQLQLHEFVRSSDPHNGSASMYRKDQYSEKQVRFVQYAPPLALKSIDAGTRETVNGWLNQLLRPKFGFMMLDAFIEGRDDDVVLPLGVLNGLYKLFLDTQDRALHDMLGIAERIYPLSYAKTHTFTLVSGEKDTILEQLQDPRKPSSHEAAHMPYITPKIANRQAKVVVTALLAESVQWHLGMVRDALDESSNIPPTTALWFRTLCLILNLALSIEKLVGLCHTSWYHRILHSEPTLRLSDEHARLHCEEDYRRTDQTFERLVALFFKRFSAGVWGKTDFEIPGTGKLKDPASKRFLTRLINLIMTRRSKLAEHMEIEPDWENMFLYRQRYLGLLFIPIGKWIDAAP